MRAFRLPWSDDSVPHAVLDILRGCNISCRACYNNRSRSTKSTKQIEQELEQLLLRRRLQCVTIVGGEPTLHPQLCQIVQMVRRRNLHPVLMSNGVNLTPQLLDDLKAAGMAMIMVHIDGNQKRPDLPPNYGLQELNDLRTRMVKRIADSGMTAGLIATGYRSRMDELVSVVRMVIESPHTDYLLVTNCTRVSRFAQVEGDLESGLKCTHVANNASDELTDEDLSVQETDAVLFRELNLHAMAYLGSHIDPNEPRWLSYAVGVTRRADGRLRHLSLRSSLTERLAVRLIRLLSGRYLFYQRESPGRFRLQLLANAMTGGHLPDTLGFLTATLQPGCELRAKHLLFQSGPTLTADGHVNHCFACPDATMRNGRLVPLCISDQIVEGACTNS